MAKNLSLDEAMIGYKGFKAALKKIYMPLKPTKVGFLIYAVCESGSGYMANFITQEATKVRRTMVEIAMSVLEPFLGVFHHVFCDKLYTGVQLARDLLAKKTYITGAVKMTAKALACDLSKDVRKAGIKRAVHIAQMKKTKRGTMYFRQNGNLTYVLWRDSSIVSMLSTRHLAYRRKDEGHRYELLRRFSIDGLQRKMQHTIPAPRQVIAYQKHMGGVDRADQLRAYHTVARKSNIWWRQLLTFLIDVCRVNAWICYRQHRAQEEALDDEMSRDRHSQFVMDIAESLIGGYREEDREYRQHLYRQRQDQRAAPPHDALGHRLQRMVSIEDKEADKAWGRNCMNCDREGRRRPNGKKITTRFGCQVCDVYLCKRNPDPRNPCFLDWHHGVRDVEIPDE